MRVASRLARLGTETAYSVSLEASEVAKKGVKVYPFHLGDLNFKTPDCIVNAVKKAIDEGYTGYCPAAGIPALKESLAHYVGEQRGVKYSQENVSIQSGGKPIIGKFLLTVMEEGDEVLYPSPGYPIYESLVNFYRGKGLPYKYIETENGFKMDMNYFKSLITPKTKVLIYNNYQNPLGVANSHEEMEEIARLCVKNDMYVMSDEPYFDIVYDIKPTSIVSKPGMYERTVIAYTFSKSFAMTGWRLGAAIGPKELIDCITKFNTNDESCTTHFIQYAGIEALKNPEAKAFTKHMVEKLKQRRDILVDLLNKVPGFKAYRQESTFYLFVNVTKALEMVHLNNVEDFRRLILERTGVSFCSREHFGTPLPGETQKYVRFAYSGIEIEQIKEGVEKLKNFMEAIN